LIEVTIAAALLGVGVAGIISGWSTTTGIIEHQRRFTDATNLTRTALEQLLLLPPNSVELAPPGPYTLPTWDAFGRPAAGSSSYTTSYVVAGDTPAPGFIEVTVTTTWTERFGARSTSFNTYRER
jgi:type II secretory pathway pseudopilin PulG